MNLYANLKDFKLSYIFKSPRDRDRERGKKTKISCHQLKVNIFSIFVSHYVDAVRILEDLSSHAPERVPMRVSESLREKEGDGEGEGDGESQSLEKPLKLYFCVTWTNNI